jgi:uncharacterized repeat protein (TIGR03803 family)
MTCNQTIRSLTVALPLLLLSTLVNAQSPATPKVTILYSFAGVPDGRGAYGSLAADQAGNLWGTTAQGGTYDCGTVFKLDSAGTETILHSFNCQDGYYPWDGVFRDPAGNLYGTTWQGGTSNLGTVFKVDSTGNFTLLHSFSGPDGDFPYGSVIGDAAGNLYGTTSGGGVYSMGTVFKVDKSGNETVLYSFAGLDGSSPDGGLMRDSTGDFYGTTTGGGVSDRGTVFKLAPDGTETVLYSFMGNPDGQGPDSALIRDQAGNFYGTTGLGGSFDAGTVFKLDKNGTETLLHTFRGQADGQGSFAGLARDSAGNLYGTTEFAGTGSFGTVYKLDMTGKETVYSFTNSPNGSYPFAGLLWHGGALYGTTTGGGAFGEGAVFKISQ